MLFEPPFTNIHDKGLFGVFDDAQVTNVIKLIDKVNENAQVSGFSMNTNLAAKSQTH
jgi:type I restriction enzyme R subunit